MFYCCFLSRHCPVQRSKNWSVKHSEHWSSSATQLSSFWPPSPSHPSLCTLMVESSFSSWFGAFSRHSSPRTRCSVQGLPLIFLPTSSYSLQFLYSIMKKDENEMGNQKVTGGITEQNGIVRLLDANWFS